MVKYLPRKYLQKGLTANKHCKTAFTKHVLPRFSSPHTPGVAWRRSIFFAKITDKQLNNG